jgi:archaellum component FlaC
MYLKVSALDYEELFNKVSLDNHSLKIELAEAKRNLDGADYTIKVMSDSVKSKSAEVERLSNELIRLKAKMYDLMASKSK